MQAENGGDEWKGMSEEGISFRHSGWDKAPIGGLDKVLIGCVGIRF